MNRQAEALLSLPVDNDIPDQPVVTALNRGESSRWLAARNRRKVRPTRFARQHVPDMEVKESNASELPHSGARPVGQTVRHPFKNVNQKPVSPFHAQLLNGPITQTDPAQAFSGVGLCGLETDRLEHEMTLDMLNQEPSYEGLYAFPNTGILRSLSRNRVVAGLIGLCVLASSVYAGLGFWWLNARATSRVAEPVNLLNIKEDASGGNPLLKNINALQKNPIVVPREVSPNHGILLAQAKPVKVFSMSELKSTNLEPTGRPDPFAPLIQTDETGNAFDPSAKAEEEKPKDLLQDLQYTGFIGDVNSRDKLAIIKVADTGTMIKKVGDSFYVEGQRVILKTVSKNRLQLNLAGKSRELPLNPYQDSQPDNGQSASGSAAAASNATSANAGQAGSAASSAGFDSTRSSRQQINSLNPKLRD